MDIGNITFTSSGEQDFKFLITGKNASSGAYQIAISSLILTPELTGITTDEPMITIQAGNTHQLTYLFSNIQDDAQGIIWSITSGNNCVTVNDEGLVTGIKEGTAIVRAASNRYEGVYVDYTINSEATPTEPQIVGANGATGWEKITEFISKIDKGSHKEIKIVINMEQETILPKEVITTMEGKNISVELQMDGYSWMIHGKDITGDELNDVELSITTNTEAIPAATVESIAGKHTSMQLQLAHDGEFGFTATLLINMDKKNKGLIANLYYYDPMKKILCLQSVDKLDSKGNVELTFTHASNYIIVLVKKGKDRR